MLPWQLLDFVVIAPADSLALVHRLHGGGGVVQELADQTSLDEVAIAVGGDPEGDPDWVVTTRARRGVRPLDSTTLDHLSRDIDLPGAGADAVRHLLLMTLPAHLDHVELVARVDRAIDESGELGAHLRHFPDATDSWVREALVVDGQRYALWVHRRAEGWAATADLGYATVTVFGTVEPEQWAFSGLSPRAARMTLGG